MFDCARPSPGKEEAMSWKPFIASQRVRPPSGKGAARQPGASVAWRPATGVAKRTQQVVKRRY